MKRSVIVSLTATLILGAATALWAIVPPPPVNQTYGIYDTSFANLTIANCHECHGTDAALGTLHHALLNTVPTPSCINSTGTSPATLATGCHTLTANPAPSSGFSIQDPTNCFNCHNTSPHHTTAAAAAQNCQSCHGATVDRPDDGHAIATTPISSMTPLTGGRTVANPAGGTMIVQGCEACHQAAPAGAAREIFSNEALHHGTGIGQGNAGSVGTCQWCHGTGATSFNIRACEACHGVPSLHSIQVDSPAPANLGTIVPGQEALGYGHIGNNWDCVGCHYSWTGASAADTTATVPSIVGLSSQVVRVGNATNLIITGNSFTNSNANGAVYTPVVVLTNGDDTIKLTPFSFTVSEIQVAIPATLPLGVYELRVDKSGTISNLSKLVVAPVVAIKSAVLAARTLTISGTGFGSTPTPEFQAQLAVFVGDVQATTVSWSNTRIVATSPSFAARKAVTVNTLFGKVAANITAAAKKVK